MAFFHSFIVDHLEDLVGSLVLFAGLVVFGLGYLLAQHRNIGKRLDGMDRRLDGMDRRLDAMDRRLDGIDRQLEGLREDLRRLARRIDHLFGLLPVITLPNSPLRLTDIGERLAEELRAQDIVDAHRPYWEPRMAAASSLDPETLDTVAWEVVETLPLSDAERSLLRECAVRELVSYQNVRSMLVVLIREDFLRRHAPDPDESSS